MSKKCSILNGEFFQEVSGTIKCLVCPNQKVINSSGSTGNLYKHLKRKHPHEYNRFEKMKKRETETSLKLKETNPSTSGTTPFEIAKSRAKMPTELTPIRQLVTISASGFAVLTGYSLYKGHESWYENLVMPLFRMLDAETSHRYAILVAKFRITSRLQHLDPPELGVNVLGLNLKNPIGLAAGFDKDGEAVKSLLDMGFAFVEIGSVTPEPQPGNPKPRVFRLLNEKAIINRYGFNSDGHTQVAKRLISLKSDGSFKGIIGVNLGKNRNSQDPVQDYVAGVRTFAPLADYLVINVSSPNTPGLRDLQKSEQLKDLLSAVRAELDLLGGLAKPLLLKLSPDLSDKEKHDIALIIMQPKTRVDGLIVSNTTSSSHPSRTESGGLSGKPVKNMSTALIADMFKLTNGSIPIIGVGGVFSGEDALDKIKSGASLVEIYTSFAIHGPPRVTRIKRELQELLEKENFKSIREAVGSIHHK